MSYSTPSTIKVVTQRELQVALKSKAIMVSLAIVVIAMLVGVFVAAYFSNKDEEPLKLAVVGTSAEPFTTSAQGKVDVSSLDSSDDATAHLLEGDIDAAVVKTDKGFDFVYDGSPDSELVALVSGVVEAGTQDQALEKLGISPEEFASAKGSAELNMQAVEDDQEANMQAIVTVLIAVSLMSFFIILFAGNIGGRVTEEKSSRVVEIILAAARPLDFLAGKILANTIVGVITSAVLFTIGAVALKVSGLMDTVDLDLTVIPLMLVAFILGLMLFGSLYAAAGSMVSRTEDLQSTQTPIMMLIFAMIYAPVFGMSKLDSTIMQVLAWIPPTSFSVAPLQLAAGNMNLLQVIGSFAVALIVTLAILALVARIYQTAILHNGKKMTWKAAISGR